MPFMMSKVMSLPFPIVSRLNAIDNVVLSGMIAMNDLSRIPDYNRVRRNIEIHKSKGRDKDIVPNRDIPDNTRITSNPDIVSDPRIALPVSPEFHANRNSLIDRTILPNNHFVVHGHIAAMDQEKPFTNPGMPTDLDARPQGTAP